ncbi:MAG: hypothetical protein HY064_00825 [Bacteroidetes bacterium]|nr:hypothetical protein [Bacteroidota bacterium]
MKNILTLFVFVIVISGNVFSQDSIKPSPTFGELKYVITGDVFYGFKYLSSPRGNTATFTTLGYNPVILYKLSDKLFFEGEIEFQTSRWQEDPSLTSGNAAAEGVAVELEYANMNYVINKYMLFKAGALFTPYGVFEDWYHQRISNRFTSRPVGIGHGGIEPGSDEGIELNGGIPIGIAKMHYAVALLNGAKLITQQEDASNTTTQNIGNLEYENIIDNNTNKALVARIGILPFSDNCLEFGGWYGSQVVSATGDKLNSNVKAIHSGVYFSFAKDIEPIKGTITVRSQYSMLSVGNFLYTLSSDTGTNIGKQYSFANNNSHAYYASFNYRGAMMKNKYLKRIEVGVRYGSVTYPDKAYGNWIMPTTSSAAKSRTQLAYVVDYWLKWNAVIKIAYEQNYIAKDPVKGTTPATPPGTLVIQFAMGL